MKFLETRFDEYIDSVRKTTLHPKLRKIFDKCPNRLSALDNMIFHGPSGVGKYSQMLKMLEKYSPTHLKYEKKMSIVHDKKSFSIKMSDIHFEVDMSLLGCVSKTLWNDIYQQIVEVVHTQCGRPYVIVCKEFHHVHSELLEVFYSYIQKNRSSNVNIKFILLTEEYSFIPDQILNCCMLIRIARPSHLRYTKCLTIASDVKYIKNANIKALHLQSTILNQPHKIMCDKIVAQMVSIEMLNFMHFRDVLYDIFIYNLGTHTCIWYILTSLFKMQKIKKSSLSDVLHETCVFLKLYNNNYRPIYHLENYLYYLISIIHEFTKPERISSDNFEIKNDFSSKSGIGCIRNIID